MGCRRGLDSTNNSTVRDLASFIENQMASLAKNKKKTWTVLIVVGHYLYVEMDDGGYADAGILQSPFFPAPTASVWDSSSPMYGKCQVR